MSHLIWPSGWPTEPRGLSDAEWWRQEERFAAEDDARPTYEELMEQYENEVDNA